MPALRALLKDAKFALCARFGLEPIADSSADDALRNALQRQGRTAGRYYQLDRHRQDAKAVGALTRLLDNADRGVAQAAVAALGRISEPQSAKALQDGLSKTKGPVRTTVAAGALVCAEGFLAQGERNQALTLYAP